MNGNWDFGPMLFMVMDTRQTTAVIIILTVVLWIVWDLFVATNNKSGDTESEVIRDYTIYPVLPVGLGVIAGHWTLLGASLLHGFAGLAIILIIGVFLILWSLVASAEAKENMREPSRLLKTHRWVSKRPYVPFIGGYILGAFLWGQAHSGMTLG